jgi:hypothetical protein
MWKVIVAGIFLFYMFSSLGYERIASYEYNFPYNGGAYHTTKEIMTIALDTSTEYRSLILQDTKITYNVALAPPLDSVPEYRKMSIAVVCGQHGRELISSEICIHLMLHLKGMEKSKSISSRLNALVESGVQFWVLPLANPWSREFVEYDVAENACRRTNGKEVDLNRNFPCPDFVRGKHQKGSVEYPGPDPLSEWETNFTLSFLERANAHILLNVHSGEESILLPYDCSTTAVHPYQRSMEKLAVLSIINASMSDRVKYGKASKLLYEAHGTLGDYASHFMGVPFVYTLEVYGDRYNRISEEDITPQQCMELFNPKRGIEYTSVVERWLLFIVSMAENAMTYFEPRDMSP